MPRISKKERIRRERISRGLKRYWRAVKSVAREEGITVVQARGVIAGVLVPVAPGIVLPTFLPLPEFLAVPPPEREVRLTQGEGEFAYNLEDVNRSEQLGIPETFRGRTVEVDMRFTRRGVEFQTRTLEFEGGESDEEFWSNYYGAFRDAYDDLVETADEEDIPYDETGIEAMALRSA